MRARRLILAAVATAAILPALGGTASAAIAPPGFLGVNSSWSLSADDYDLMDGSSVGVMRTGFVYAGVKQERTDPWNWSSFDTLVTNTAVHGIDLMPVLFGVPPWVSTERSTTPIGKAEGAWQAFLQAVVGRYGPGGHFWAENEAIPYRPIEDWQVWNEPNSRTWWQPRPKPKEYGRLLAMSARAIHEVDPQARVMTAGIVAKPTNAAAIMGNEYLEQLYRSRAARKATDLVAFHPYAPTAKAVDKQLHTARKTLKKAKMGSTPITVTEVGWGSVGPKDHPLIMPSVELQQQFQRLLQNAVDDRRRLILDSLLWYHWRDFEDDLCLWCESSGMLNEAGEPKPLLDIFASIARK